MVPPRRVLVVFVVLVGSVLGTACADTPGCDESLRVCDIGSSSCQEHVYVQTACARGFDGRTPPPVDSITRQEYVERLRSDAPPSAEELLHDAQLATSMRMLRLATPDTTSNSDAAILARAESVLAFYDPVADRVTLIETNLGGAERSTEVFVLSHEFVHAQADLDVDLVGFLETHVTSFDSAVAARAVAEGDAMHYANLTMARRANVAQPSLADFRGYYADMQARARQSAADPEVGYQALASGFPYPFGGQLVAETWFSSGDVGVLELYDEPWASTGDVLRLAGDEPPRGAPDVPPLDEPVLPDGWVALADDTLGAWLGFAFAVRHEIDTDEARVLVDDWTGDRILAVGGAGAADVALVWRVRFASERSAETFARAGERPPAEGAWSITQDGAEVTIVAAPDPDALSQWTSTFTAAMLEHSLPLRAEAAATRLAPGLRAPTWPLR